MAPIRDIFPRKDRRKEKNYTNRLLRKLKVGMFVEDCRYHPSIVTSQDHWNADFTCESLVNGRPNACSMWNCGPEPLSKDEAYERAAFMKTGGMELYLRRYHDYSDAAIEHWRKLDAEWNFDKG